MSSWVIAVIGLAIVAGLIMVARKWGQTAAEKRILKANLNAAETRKAIDNEIKKLTPNELLDRLRAGL